MKEGNISVGWEEGNNMKKIMGNRMTLKKSNKQEFMFQ
jgi:hypothetical protein